MTTRFNSSVILILPLVGQSLDGKFAFIMLRIVIQLTFYARHIDFYTKKNIQNLYVIFALVTIINNNNHKNLTEFHTPTFFQASPSPFLCSLIRNLKFSSFRVVTWQGP